MTTYDFEDNGIQFLSSIQNIHDFTVFDWYCPIFWVHNKEHADILSKLNPINTKIQAPTKITFVMVLFTAFLYKRKVALRIKAMDIGFKYSSIPKPDDKYGLVYKMATNVIKAQAGKIQTIKVSIASVYPPSLYPMSTIVCVEDAPGSNWHNALYSISSASLISFLVSTNLLCNKPKLD
jgi:hypothetical protein